MWGQIAQAIAKVYAENEETKRHGIDKVADASKAGEGANGADYSNLDTGAEGGNGGSVGSGYQKPSEQSTSATSGFTSAAGNLIGSTKDALSNIDKDKKGDKDEEDKEEVASAIGNMDMGNMDMGSIGGDTGSDERLKRIFGDNEDAIKAFSKINAIKFEYNDKAKEVYPDGEKNVDDDPHYGVKAQDLEKNPYTASTVQKDPESGYLNVNTQELTMANSAVISDICKRLLAIENILGIKVV